MTDLHNMIDACEKTASMILNSAPEIAFSEYERRLFTQTSELTSHFEQRDMNRKEFVFDDLPPLSNEQKKDFHITIIGAGSAGLLSAFQLGTAGFHVTLYEKREKELTTLRYPNISFKEGDKTLKPMLGDDIYTDFLASGGSMDGNTGKLRLTIGRFQEILLQHLETLPNVDIHFNQFFSFDDDELYQNADLVLIATGAHSAKRFELEAEFSIEKFPAFNAKGITALYIQGSDSPHGYYRTDIEGYAWRRDNKSVYSGQAFRHDLRRVERQICDNKLKTMISDLIQADSVEYTFSFGNDTPHFFENPPLNIDPVLLARYEVKPQIALSPLFHFRDKTVIAMGDANGTPHPLAAIGTLKFVRNIIHLKTFVTRQCAIKLNSSIDKRKNIQMNEAWYVNEAMKNIEEVFFANLFSSIYSRPRQTS